MNDKITKEYIIDQLRSDKNVLIEKYGVIKIGLFGSYAKSKNIKDSDIDFIVELKSPKYEWMAGLQIYLENKFNRKIELIRKSRLTNNRFIHNIEKDVIYV
jgi:predicted nucleotidyltransferase